MEKTVYTVKEAAAVMRISPSSLYALVRANKVPHISVGKRQIIPAARFHAWLDAIVEGG